MTHPLPTIYRDTRERKPWHLLDGGRCVYEDVALYVGDYALAEFCTLDGNAWVPSFVIERKAPPDYLGSFFPSPTDEYNKMRKGYAKGVKMMYVLDGSEVDLRRELNRAHWKRFRNGRGLQWPEVSAQIQSLRVAGIHIIMSPSRHHAETTSFDLMMADATRRRKGAK